MELDPRDKSLSERFHLIASGAALIVPALAFSLVSSESFRFPKLWSGEMIVFLAGLAGLFLAGGRTGDRVALGLSLMAWGALASFPRVSHALTGADELARIASFFVLFSLLRKGGRVGRLLPLLLLAGAANALIALAQSSGWRPQWWVVWEERHAIYGTFGNPNFLAEYLAPLAVLALGALLGSAPVRIRRLGLVCWLLFVAVLVLTVSRSAWLGLAVGVAVFLALSGAVRAMLRWRRMALGLAVGGLVVFVASGRDAILNRVTSTFSGPEPGVSTRAFMWNTAGDIFREHPLLGAGPGGYSLDYLEYGARRQEAGKGRPAYAGITREAHNDYLQALADRGLLGALLFVGVLGLMGASALRALGSATPAERIVRASALGGLAAVGVTALFGFPMRIFPTFALAAWMLARAVPPRPAGAGAARYLSAATALWALAGLAVASRLFLADSYMKAGNDSGRPEWFMRGSALLPSHGELHFRAGLALAGAGKTAEAAGEFSSALAGFRDPDVYFNLGALAKSAGRHAEAVRWFGEGLRLYPFYKAVAWVDLAESQLAAGDRAGARKSAECALAIEPQNARAWAVVERLGRTPKTRKK